MRPERDSSIVKEDRRPDVVCFMKAVKEYSTVRDDNM